MRKLIFALIVSLGALAPFGLLAQGRTVSGRVTDANLKPVAGVSITVSRTNNGTVSDADGKFT